MNGKRSALYGAFLIACLTSAALAQTAGERLCTEVMRLYPLEYIDQAEWWQTCQRTSDVERLLRQLNDPLARVATEPDVSSVDYQSFENSTVGYLQLTGFLGGEEFVALVDAELEKARYDDGLILDLRGAGGGDAKTAYQILARLTNAPIPGVTIRKRLPGTEDYKEKSFTVQPRGEWQVEVPVVILCDQSTYWPSNVILLAAKERPQMETVGVPTRGTKAVEPMRVELPGGASVWIPTAIATTSAGVRYNGQPFEPNVNLNHDPPNTSRDPHDPVLARGADEVFRLMGRLEWLREEQRKRLLEEGHKEKIETH